MVATPLPANTVLFAPRSAALVHVRGHADALRRLCDQVDADGRSGLARQLRSYLRHGNAPWVNGWQRVFVAAAAERAGLAVAVESGESPQ